MSWFDSLLWPIMVAVAWIMVTLHHFFVWTGLDGKGGASWVLSIVGLTVVIRVILIPLFIRQIRAARGLQIIQPELQALQKRYKGKTDQASREAMAREQMELYKKHNTNPFSSCLPILAQSPVFFALFRVLNSLKVLAAPDGLVNGHSQIGPLTRELAGKAEHATLFGAPLSGTFTSAPNGATRIVTVVLIVTMSLTQFFMQRQLTMKNMPPAALEGPIAQQQKMLMYVMPLIFAFSGINFPIGVLVYWTVSNLWTVGQQFYSIRRMPAPGSEAEVAFKARQARKAERQGGSTVTPTTTAVIDEAPARPSGQRQQPVRKDRAKKQVQRPDAAGPGTAGPDREGEGSARPGTDGARSAPLPEMDVPDVLGESASGSRPAGSDGPRRPAKPRKGGPKGEAGGSGKPQKGGPAGPQEPEE